MDTLLRHRRMLFNPGYGTVGLIAMPYFFLFEFLGPVVEIAGYIAVPLSYWLGFLQVEFAIAYFAAAVGLGTLLSVAAIFTEELWLHRYPRWSDTVRLTLYSVLENLGYRQLNTIWRAWAIISFLRKNQSWGAMERQGFDPATTSQES